MRLYQRGEIWWCWYYDQAGHQQRVSTRCTDRKAAESIAREYERQAADPAYAASKTYSLESCLVDFLAERKEAGKSAGTLRMYRQKAGTLVRLLGAELSLSELTAERMDRYLAARLTEKVTDDRTVTRMTVSKELSTLSGALKLATRHGKFSKDLKAILPVKFDRDHKPRQTYLTREQAEGLMEHLEPERAAHVAFLLGTAARLSEAASARREDVELANDLVYIRETKTRRARTPIPIVSMTRPLLQRALRDAPRHAGDTLFPQWLNGRRDLLRACTRAGVPVVTFNDLRRTLATWLVQSGVSLFVTSRILRHKSTRMIEQVYGVMSAESLGRLIEEAQEVKRVETPSKSNCDNPPLVCDNSVIGQPETTRLIWTNQKKESTKTS